VRLVYGLISSGHPIESQPRGAANVWSVIAGAELGNPELVGAAIASVTTNVLRQRSMVSAAGASDAASPTWVSRQVWAAGSSKWPVTRTCAYGSKAIGRLAGGMDGHEQSRNPHLSRISRCLQTERRACEPGRLWGSRAVGLAAAEPGRIEGQRGIAAASDGVASRVLRSGTDHVDKRADVPWWELTQRAGTMPFGTVVGDGAATGLELSGRVVTCAKPDGTAACG
jgi:hypothetical protein